MIFELGNEKVVITCQITYISPLGRISGRKATGIGLSGSCEGPRNQIAGVEVSSTVSSLDDSPSSSCASACHSSSRSYTWSWVGSTTSSSSSSSSDGGTGEGSRRLLPPPFPRPLPRPNPELLSEPSPASECGIILLYSEATDR